MCSTMPNMSPAWEEHHCFVISEVTSLQLWLEFWLTLCRDVDALFVTLDANFRLRRCAVSSDENDPSLSCGWSYFVEETTFKTYLHDHKDDIQEVCSHTIYVLLHSQFGQEKQLFKS